MGPGLVGRHRRGLVRPGGVDRAHQGGRSRDFKQTVRRSPPSDAYAALLGPVTDAQLRETINMFGTLMHSAGRSS